MPQYGKSRAKAFNVGDDAKGTGVRFADVAGIDGIKDEIQVVMDMLLGAEEYAAIGARPFRVRPGLSIPSDLGINQPAYPSNLVVYQPAYVSEVYTVCTC